MKLEPLQSNDSTTQLPQPQFLFIFLVTFPNFLIFSVSLVSWSMKNWLFVIGEDTTRTYSKDKGSS